jgi:5-methylcytosine-specific restriction endonuclease McrA
MDTFAERFDYLRLYGEVGAATFGFDRWINQQFYRSQEWKLARRDVLIRDNGCDLGIPGYEIHSGVFIHHMNPIALQDILQHEHWIFDPEYLITTTQRTHNAIHFSDESLLPKVVIARSPNDTRLW